MDKTLINPNDGDDGNNNKDEDESGQVATRDDPQVEP